jgi:DNA-directed RNA polymerase specialized sigma24 family protein
MDQADGLAERFQAHHTRLRVVAYQTLGSLSEADDAVQEAWLRVSRAGTGGVDNLGGWLTTVVARVCLDMLRSRAARRGEPLGVHLPDPVISQPDALDPEQQALLAEGIGLALLVVLDTLAPAERLAPVPHDSFAVPFEEIAAARNGDLEALVAILDPDAVAEQALAFAQRAPYGRPALVNGAAGVVVAAGRRLIAVMGFTVTDGKITEIDILADPERLQHVDLTALDD